MLGTPNTIRKPASGNQSAIGGGIVMLVLSRKEDQCIRINDNIVIRIVQIRGDRVRIGVDAPRDVAVHREEILQTLLQEKLKFGQSSSEESSDTVQAMN